MKRRELTRSPVVRALLRNRWPQFLATALLLAGFVLAITAGIAGTPVGNRNLGIVGVWIAWWAALILVAVPILGRAWCAVCPIPAPGEWIQRGGIMGSGTRPRGLGRRFPRFARNMWLQNAAFATLAVFSVVILTQPLVTATLLLVLLVLAAGMSLVFERRAFCRYVCPVGGFVGLYAQTAPIELRARDPATCAGHRDKVCFTGSSAGCGCPWIVYPGMLQQNTYCGLCLECLRTCPLDNVILNWRPFGADLALASPPRLDEAFKALLMLGSAIAYAAVMLGPWAALREAAFRVGSASWFLYAGSFLLFVLVAVPGGFLGSVALDRAIRKSTWPLRKAYARFATALIPLGLAAWIAFTLSFILANVSYVWPVLSDPFGFGWDVLGTAKLPWRPMLTWLTPPLQVVALVGGLAWAAVLIRRIAAESALAAGRSGQTVSVLAFCLLLTLGLLWLLIG